MPTLPHSPTQLATLKRELSPSVLAHPAVVGLGVGAGGLRVYLKKSDAGTEAQVRALIGQVDAQVPVECIVSGAFARQLP